MWNIRGSGGGYTGEKSVKEKGLKGFDHKTCPKLDRWDYGLSEFHSWYDLLVATMSAYDDRWEGILNAIESYGKETISEHEVEDIRDTLEMTEEDLKKALQCLYLSLLTYTKGDAHNKTTSGGPKGSFEAYRHSVQR